MTASLLPPNATRDEIAMAEVLGEQIAQIPVPIADLWNVDRCPVAMLPWLAWALSVDEWDADWPEQRKRDVIRGSIDWHRRKGTPAAMREVLEAMGYPGARIREYRHRPLHDGTLRYGDGTRYERWENWADYRVVVDGAVAPREASRIEAVLREVAPARCRLVRVNLTSLRLTYNGTATYGGGYRYGGTIAQAA